MKKQNIFTFIGFLITTIFLAGIVITNLYSSNWSNQSKSHLTSQSKNKTINNNQQSKKTKWFLNPKKTLKQNVKQWGRQTGWTVIWHAKNYKVQSKAIFHGHLNQKNGPFEQLVKHYGEKHHFLKINLYLNDKKIVVSNDSKAIKKYKKIVQKNKNKKQSKKNNNFKLALNQIKKRINAQEKQFNNQNKNKIAQIKQKNNDKTNTIEKLHIIASNDHINNLISKTQSNFVKKLSHKKKKNNNQNNLNNSESNAIAKAEEKLGANPKKQINKHKTIENKTINKSNNTNNKVDELAESNVIAKAERKVSIKNKKNNKSNSNKVEQSKKKIVNQKQNSHSLPANTNQLVIKQNNLKNDLMPLFIYEHSGVVLSDQFNILKQGKIKSSSILSFSIIAQNDLNEVEINVADSILNRIKQEKKAQKKKNQQQSKNQNRQEKNNLSQNENQHKKLSQSHKSKKTQSKTKNHIEVGNDGQHNLMVYLHNTFKVTKNVAHNMVQASWTSSSQYNINSKFMLSFLSAQVKLYGSKKKHQYADFQKLMKDVYHFNKLLNQKNHNMVKTIMDFDHMTHKVAKEYNQQIKGIYTNINHIIKATKQSKQ